MKILAIGDVMGRPGRRAVKELLPGLVKEFSADFVIVNGENSAGGLGLTAETGREIFSAGADVITSGNHIWHHKEVGSYLMSEKRCLRPANYPKGAPGRGWVVVESKKGVKVGVLNLQGRVFMPPIDCPFQVGSQALKEIRQETEVIIVDMHAEATSEKVAIGRYFSGQVSFVYGTHTHVQTADEKILRGGTAFICDIGMTGPHDSVIGMDARGIIDKFINQRPQRFEVAKDGVCLNGACVEIDASTGQALKIERIQRDLAA